MRTLEEIMKLSVVKAGKVEFKDGIKKDVLLDKALTWKYIDTFYSDVTGEHNKKVFFCDDLRRVASTLEWHPRIQFIITCMLIDEMINGEQE